MLFNASFNLTPCFPPPRVYLLGEPTSLLVVANTHPPLSLVCQQLPHPLLAFPPFHTPQFPTVQVTLFTQMTSEIPVILIWNKYILQSYGRNLKLDSTVDISSTVFLQYTVALIFFILSPPYP